MKLFFLLITVVLFIGCSKEDKRIRYRIISQGTSEISYSMRGGPLKFETVTGDWSKSFRSRSGNPLYLSATKTSIIGGLTVQISVDGDVAFSLSTNDLFQTITIDTTVP